jgi:hypothetical protein
MSQSAEQVREVPEHEVEIAVNGKPVKVMGPKRTGLEIKQAAIAQGVQIRADFQLSEELGDHKTKIIGDTDVVTVHKGSKFIAVAGDDNS